MEINGNTILQLVKDVEYIKAKVECMDRIKTKVEELSGQEHCNRGRIEKLSGKVEVLQGVRLPLSVKFSLVISILAFAAVVVSKLL